MANLKKNQVNQNELRYQGPDRVQFIEQNRNPTIRDYYNFDLGAVWLNKNPNITPLANRMVWILVAKENFTATWILHSSGASGIQTLTADIDGGGGNPVVPDGANNINVFGNVNVNASIFDLNNRNIRTIGDAANNTLEVHLNNSINLPNTTALTDGVYGIGGSRFAHKFGTSNTFIGEDGGNFTLTTAIGNTGVGQVALNSLTTGDENTAVGLSALTTVDTGSNNVAVGSSALNFATSANDNVAVGTNALSQITTGSRVIGIGTDALSSMTTANESIAIGFQALDACTVGDNIAIGDQAAGAITTGTRNIAIGNDALIASDTGRDNLAIGFNAASSITTGIQNIAIGTNAGNTNITANNTIAIGRNALQNNLQTNNIAIGVSSLASNTTGTGNHAFGTGALQNNTTGINNVANGAFALTLNNGDANTAVGNSALSSATAADHNTILGAFAADNATSAQSNSGVGSSVFASLTTGAQNVAVGRQCLNGLTTGSNNISIGYLAGGTVTTGGSNILIGQSAAAAAESNTIRIGTPGVGAGQQNRNFQAGIRGITTGVADAIAVLIDSAHQLGTVSSSIRFKENIKNMMDESSAIYDLRPVTFNYKEDESKSKQYGLIAEEAEKYIPRLVVYDEEGLPMALNDRFLPFMLLNELQKLQARVKDLEKRLEM